MVKTNQLMRDGIKPVIKCRGVSSTQSMMFAAVIVLAAAGALFLSHTLRQPALAEVTVYKSPTCKCCDRWVDHMRAAGFQVTTQNSDDMDGIKSSYGVPPALHSCHTAMVQGYVIEGHVPAQDIIRLLAEKPEVTGLAAPGMPKGSPGMEGEVSDPYNVMAIYRDGKSEVFARH